MAMRRLIGSLGVLAGLALAAGCGGSDEAATPNGGGPDIAVADGSGALDGIAGLDGGGGTTDGVAIDTGGGGEPGGECGNQGLPDDEFWVVFGQRGRIPGTNDDQFDLYIMNQDGGNPLDPNDTDPLSVTGFSLSNQSFAWCSETAAPLSCSKGCFVDRNLKWIAVAVPVPTAAQLDPTKPEYDPAFDCLSKTGELPDASKGFSLLLGKFDPSLHVSIIKGAIFKNISDFHFAGGKMFYSKLASCAGPSCTYNIFMRDLEKDVNKENLLFSFPPDAESLDDSIYKGHFTVSADGEVIAILNPTIRSQSYWVWRNGAIQRLNLLCTNRQSGQCIGTGSEYSDKDPLAMSPDNTLLQTFTVAEGKLRAWVYHTQQDLEPLWSNLTQVPSGSNYKNNICAHMTEDWQYAYVNGTPRFSADGKSIYYLGRSECNDLAKPETDILEIGVSVIGNGKPIGSEDVRNVTRNPKDSTPDNTVIQDFDLCPGGKTLLLNATPTFDKQGKKLGDDSQTARKDLELFLIGTNGCGKTQITTELSFETVAPLCVKPKTL